MHYRSFLIIGSTLSWASAQSTFTTQPAAVSISSAPVVASTNEPCAIIASKQLQTKDNATTTISAELGAQCFQSVPVDKAGDAQLVDELKLFLSWNTDASYFKDLPEWYDNPSFDLFAELDDIKAAILNDTYQSEWEVQNALHALFVRTGDNHITWDADINSVMVFRRTNRLVSVSSDGKSTPKIYVYGDLSLLQAGVHNFSASSVEQINGEDVVTYLSKVARQGNFHDRNARYNALFPNQAGHSLGKATAEYFTTGLYDGPNTTFTFANGTSNTYGNMAVLEKNFTGVGSGNSFFSKFCQPEPTTTPSALPSGSSTFALSSTPTPIATFAAQPSGANAPGYPAAVILHRSNAIGGYYLNDSSQVAVLSVPSFEPEYDDPSSPAQASVDFQTVAREFLKQATADKKSKLVIDLRYNLGGATVLAFDLFKLIFPTLEPYQAVRRHAHPAYKDLLDLTTELIPELLSTANVSDTDAQAIGAIADFAWQFDTTINDTAFQSLKKYYGPYTINGDNFTSLRSWNLSNTINILSGFNVTGYGGELAFNTPTWKPSDIVLLQDGFCSSTCAIFSELMYTIAGVETLAIGGLPDDSTPMQKVGGTKGWETWQAANLQNFPAAFYYFANQTVVDAAAGTEIEAMNQSSVVFERATAFAVNAADGIRRGDEKAQTPLQFVYEAAECRIWYTVPMVFDVTETWKAAADVKWGNGTCNGGKGFSNNGTQTAPSHPQYTGGATGLASSGFAVAGTVLALLLLL